MRKLVARPEGLTSKQNAQCWAATLRILVRKFVAVWAGILPVGKTKQCLPGTGHFWLTWPMSEEVGHYAPLSHAKNWVGPVAPLTNGIQAKAGKPVPGWQAQSPGYGMVDFLRVFAVVRTCGFSESLLVPCWRVLLISEF